MRRQRPGRIEYYINIASAIAQRSSCLRAMAGAVIVKRDIILATGYAGAARGEKDCIERGKCPREEEGIPSGQRYELCHSVHAEMNACLQADYPAMEGADLYLYFWKPPTAERKVWSLDLVAGTVPCRMCRRVLKNCRIGYMIAETSFPVVSEGGESRREAHLIGYDPRTEEYELLTEEQVDALERNRKGSQ